MTTHKPQTVDRLLTIKDVAERLRVSVSTVRRMIKDGGLPIIRVHGQIRIGETELAEYLGL